MVKASTLLLDLERTLHPLVLALGAQPKFFSAVRLAIALSAALLLAWGAWLARRGRPESHRKFRATLLGVLAALAFAGGWNWGLFHLDHFVHNWDVYHYYFGAKYSVELGYTRLYQCTAAADAELGYRKEVETRQIRNLSTNLLEPAAPLLLDATPCTSHFTPERWRDFKNDVAYFRTRVSSGRWNVIPIDHGYNATPVWQVVGGLLANTGRATDAQIVALSLIDSALVLLMWGFVAWAFGSRALAVAVIVWGTNAAADFGWLGGAFLRYDWLMLLVASICLHKRGRSGWAGFALGASALLRIFPATLAFGWAVHALARKPANRKRFALGGIAAFALLVPLSMIRFGRFGPAPDGGWPGFVANSKKHLKTPSANNMGLKTLLSAALDVDLAVRPGEKEADAWWALHQKKVEERKLLGIGILAGYVLLLVRTVLRVDEPTALILSLSLVPFLFTLSCYYYVFLLVFGLLVTRGEGWGAAACTMAATTNVASLLGRWDYEIYLLASAAVLIFFVLLTLYLGESYLKRPAEALVAEVFRPPTRST